MYILYTLKSSIESSFSSMPSKINNIPSKIIHTQIDDLSAIIKNISKSSCNMDYINDMFKYFGVDTISALLSLMLNLLMALP